MDVTDVPAVLYSPGWFFEEYPPRRTLGGAVAAVLVTSLVTIVAFAGVGVAIGDAIDVTVTETTYGGGTERIDVGARVQGIFFSKIPILFVASLVGWLLTAVGLHLLTALGDARGPFGATMSVTGWASIPALVGAIAGFALLYFNVQATNFASDPTVLADQIRGLANRTGGISVLTSVVGVGWQAVVWTQGLRCGRNVEYGTAAFAAGVVAVVIVLLSL